MKYGDVVDPDSLALMRKIDLFGAQGIDGIYRFGPHKELIDKPVASLPSTTSTATIRLNNPAQYHSADPMGPRVPAYVEGEITNLAESMSSSELTIAVAVNGVIRSTTKTTSVAISSLGPEKRVSSKSTDDEDAHFLARIPPDSFVKGRNEITIYAVVEDENGKPTSLIDFSEEGKR